MTCNRRVMWLGVKCCLDTRAGAAVSVNGMLRALTRHGWYAHAVHTTLVEGEERYPLDRLLGEEAQRRARPGTVFRFEDSIGVAHRLCYVRALHGEPFLAEEEAAFRRMALEAVRELRPSVVLTYTASPLMQSLLKEVQPYCGARVFYLSNAEYSPAKRDYLASFDRILVPSRFTREHYRRLMGLETAVVPCYFDPASRVLPEEVLAVREPRRRREGWITMINPSPAKGLMLFARLVVMAARQRPDLRFLAVAGRMSERRWLEANGPPNVRWLPNQADMRPVYARTAILLFPSFWNEASGRCIAEAQLAGIPVLAANHGGMPDQLNGGGYALDVPARCRDDYSAMPTDNEVKPWLDTLAMLMDDEQAYRTASRRALQAAKAFEPERVGAQISRRFEELIAE